MEFYKELIAKEIGLRVLEVLDNESIDCAALAEKSAYEAIKKIKAVLDDDSLDDNECFIKIEKIVRVFEELGISGSRHDF